MFCWRKGLSSRGSNASSKRFNSDSTDLEIKMATEPLPHASEATGSRSCGSSGDERSLLLWDAGLLFHKGGKEACLGYRRRIRVSVTITTPCDGHLKTTTQCRQDC